MNSNILIGGLFIILATIAIVFSFLIAAREYIFKQVGTKKFAGISAPPFDLIKLFLQLLDDILKAPPALAYLVVGLLIGAAGIWILAAKPL